MSPSCASTNLVQTVAITVLSTILSCFIVTGITGCSRADDQAFVKSHDSISVGMTLHEAFDSGLADYLILMETKNIPGATLPEKQPVSSGCARHVLDISFTGIFRVRVYCGMNSPSSPQVFPEGTFRDKRAFLQALDTDYTPWAKNMEFGVESPPGEIFGVYDRYHFTTNNEGKIDTVSPIIHAQGQ